MNLIAPHIKIFKHSFVFGLLFLASLHSILSQNKTEKYANEFKIPSASYIELNAIYTDIIFTSWNKDRVAVKAYLQSPELTKEQTLEQLSSWDLKVNQLDSLVAITSMANPKLKQVSTQYNFSGDVSEQNVSEMVRSVLAPMLQNVNENPMPESLKAHLKDLHFDFNAYNQLGETYMKIWENRFAQSLDEETTAELKKWSQAATSNLIQVSKVRNNQEVVTVSQQRPKTANYQVSFIQTVTVPNSVKVNKVLEVFVPLNSKLKFKTRYGSIHVMNELNNIKATVQYSPFQAEKISGKNTSLAISFSPVLINSWDSGKLALEYVKKSKINQVNNIRLLSNSSKTQINAIMGSAKIESMFGVIDVLKLGTNFSNLSLLSNNSDLAFTIPKSAFNFAYNGNRSRIQIPEDRLSLKVIESLGNQMLHGYSVSRNTDKEIQMSVTNTSVLLR